MRKLEDFRNKIGHIVIPCSRAQVIEAFRGFGICDQCGKTAPHGYLLPVLGHRWFCQGCKDEWESRAIFYQEDVAFEDETAMEMLRMLLGLKPKAL